MLINKNWENFYTDGSSEETINHISINVDTKEYEIYNDIDEMAIDGEDSIISYYVSSEIFALLVNAVKENGYKESYKMSFRMSFS